MKKPLIYIITLVIGLLFVLGLYFITFYNSVISSKEQVQNQWAQVETQYQRRYDLIPNLVETVKGITKQEQEVFTQLAEARTRYSGANSVQEQVQAANQIESALGRLLVIVENYPELKSSESFQTLMVQLEGTENRISVERKRFNDAVQQYNLKIKRFPANVIAGMFGFDQEPYFESVDTAEQAPNIQF